MNRIFSFTTALIIAFAATLSISLPVYAGNSTAGTKIGILTCTTQPNTGFSLIIHSTVDIKCAYKATDNSGEEHYIGETGVGFGIDMRSNRRSDMVFTVFAADFKSGNHKLAGKYVGAGASATIGAGIGAQVLIGANNSSLSLKPVIEGSTGIGISAGITYLYLQAMSQ